MNIIIAPHPDDELIGCFSQISNGVIDYVIYLTDGIVEDGSLEDRRLEVNGFQKSTKLGFSTRFVSLAKLKVTLDDIISIKKLKRKDVLLYVPSMKDHHPFHKKVNRYCKYDISPKFRLMFYSVEMNDSPVLLDAFTRAKKRSWLDAHYPSQKELWAHDAKYWLFEKISESDSLSTIWVTFQKKGIHRFRDAYHDNKYKDVSYLGHPHRHLFKFRVEIEVYHNDREIEFHQFQNLLESWFENNIIQLDNQSCEMISDNLSRKIAKKYNNRYLKIEVSEDGENGTTKEYRI